MGISLALEPKVSLQLPIWFSSTNISCARGVLVLRGAASGPPGGLVERVGLPDAGELWGGPRACHSSAVSSGAGGAAARLGPALRNHCLEVESEHGRLVGPVGLQEPMGAGSRL